MATFSNWLVAHKKNPVPKQLTWLCGPETILKDDVVDAIKGYLEVDAWSYIPLVVGEDSERTIWAEADQHPIGKSKRLIVIRNAEKLEHWDRLLDWIKNRTRNPNTYLVFLSNEDRIAKTEPTPEERRKGAKAELVPHLAAFQGKGAVIECRPFTGATAKHAVTWVQSKVSLRTPLAAHLLNRANGDLRLVRDLCFKLSVLPTEPTIPTINGMLSQQPRDTFVDALLTLNKPEALRALGQLPVDDYSRIIGLLDSQLEFAETIHDMILEHKSPAEMARAVGNRGWLVADMIPISKHYNAKRTLAIRRTLATVDEHLRLGVTDGTMEALVAFF